MGVEEFRVVVDDSDEVIVPGLEPDVQVCRLSEKKAKNVAGLCDESDIIIAADTIVYYEGKILGKPACADDAKRMLRLLSGNVHSVYTGVTLLRDDLCVSAAERTDVWFRDISDIEIERYIETGEPADKAGAYAAQGGAAVFITRIEGDFFNVVGLPLCRLSMMLEEIGVSI